MTPTQIQPNKLFIAQFIAKRFLSVTMSWVFRRGFCFLLIKAIYYSFPFCILQYNMSATRTGDVNITLFCKIRYNTYRVFTQLRSECEKCLFGIISPFKVASLRFVSGGKDLILPVVAKWGINPLHQPINSNKDFTLFFISGLGTFLRSYIISTWGLIIFLTPGLCLFSQRRIGVGGK